MDAFPELAATGDATLDALSLSLAAEFGDVDVAGALSTLDALGSELAQLASADDDPPEQAHACAELLGRTHGFTGDRDDYDHPDNSMLDRVLERRRGLPILLSTVYVEVARRAGIELHGVGLPGHFVVGHFGTSPPMLLDPFGGGHAVEAAFDERMVRPWRPHAIAMRMLNNLVNSFGRRGDVGAAIRAAELRLALPADDAARETLKAELRSARARLN